MKERIPIETDHAERFHLMREALSAIDEAVSGRTKHGPLMSFHEGYAVLKEEVDELWQRLMSDNLHRKRQEEIRLVRKAGLQIEDEFYFDELHMECVQIAAVALRLACAAQRLEGTYL